MIWRPKFSPPKQCIPFCDKSITKVQEYSTFVWTEFNDKDDIYSGPYIDKNYFLNLVNHFSADLKNHMKCRYHHWFYFCDCIRDLTEINFCWKNWNIRYVKYVFYPYTFLMHHWENVNIFAVTWNNYIEYSMMYWCAFIYLWQDISGSYLLITPFLGTSLFVMLNLLFYHSCMTKEFTVVILLIYINILVQ